MIILDSTTKTLEAKTTATPTTKLEYYISFVDITTTTYIPSESHGSGGSGIYETFSTIVSAPGTSTQRSIKYINIYNSDNITHDITLRINDSSGTTVSLIYASLLAGENLSFTDKNGWQINCIKGCIKNDINVGVSNFSAGTTNVSSGQIVFSNSNNITFGLNGLTMTASFDRLTMSSFQNEHMASSLVAAPAVSANSILVQAVQFNLGAFLNVDFVRFPVSFTTNSTSLGTSANTSGSCQIWSTLMAGIYKQDSGAESTQLDSVLIGSCSWNQLHSMTANSNGSQWSVSDQFTGHRLGSTFSTSYSTAVSQTRFDFSTNNFGTEFSGPRYLDIPLNSGNQTLSPGAYWLVFGVISSSSTNSVAFAAYTNCNIIISGLYCNSQLNAAMGPMNVANRTNIPFGVGRMTAAFGSVLPDFYPITAISSTASNPQMVFQLRGGNGIL